MMCAPPFSFSCRCRLYLHTKCLASYCHWKSLEPQEPRWCWWQSTKAFTQTTGTDSPRKRCSLLTAAMKRGPFNMQSYLYACRDSFCCSLRTKIRSEQQICCFFASDLGHGTTLWQELLARQRVQQYGCVLRSWPAVWVQNWQHSPQRWNLIFTLLSDLLCTHPLEFLSHWCF